MAPAKAGGGLFLVLVKFTFIFACQSHSVTPPHQEMTMARPSATDAKSMLRQGQAQPRAAPKPYILWGEVMALSLVTLLIMVL